MKQEEKWKEAFSNVAIKETEQFEGSLTYEERRKAEALYKRHKDTALHLIRKQKGFLFKWTAGIAVAAAAVLLVLWGLNRPVPDTITPATEPVSTVISANTSEPQQTETPVPASENVAPTSHVLVLEAHLVDFPRGEKYSVYTGPGEQYERVNNKAVVSTNDWIQVFGVEQGYAMIQYAITSGQRRIGYINAVFLPDNASVSTLEFSYIPAVITQKTELTDDPLGGRTSLHTIRDGTEVLLLAVMDDWMYVEWNGGEKPVRGFVPATAIQQDNSR